MKNYFKFQISGEEKTEIFCVVGKKKMYSICEKFIKDALTKGFIPTIYQDCGGVWKIIG
ncbi:MAG: hypothetical protein L6Q29_03580 [Candidatus Pacebacteria bacterium]|nr:hypothetical protein [Candidatus Paceibacterota bacterium]NUQ57488.1 hypothetical protein [Candidatus Paceibacter sp.]